MDGTGDSDDDSFGGESSGIHRMSRFFDLVWIDVSSPCPTGRHVYGTDAAYGHMVTPGLLDYGDDIDEYPEYGNQVNVHGNGDPSYQDPETCGLLFREAQRSLRSPKM